MQFDKYTDSAGKVVLVEAPKTYRPEDVTISFGEKLPPSAGATASELSFDMSPAIVWVTGRWQGDIGHNAMWDILGIYASHGRAVERCAHKDDFVAPHPFDVHLPDESALDPWPGMYFPLRSPLSDPPILPGISDQGQDQPG